LADGRRSGMKPKFHFLLLLGLTGFIFLAFQIRAVSPPAAKAGLPGDDGCLKCHEGIETIGEGPVMSNLPCGQCHLGNPAGTSKEEAHKGMYANPADLRVAGRTCGLCHPVEIETLKKSLHATSAGKISGARYANAAQKSRNAIYANYDIEDKDGNVPEKKGAVPSLKQLSLYDPSKPISETNHLIDDYLREQCLRCHVWSSGHERAGDYRASGCAACHILYSNQGTYEGGDKAIPKDQRDRPRFHRITAKIPHTQCLHCHNRGGRTGMSFIGKMESDGYGSPWAAEAGKKGGEMLHGKYYNHLKADVHHQKGMECIDCHTKQDLHGDGNIYSKRWQAVEIECTDCHGNAKAHSNIKTSWGNPLKNLKKENSQVVLTSKMDKRQRAIPQVKDILAQGPPLARTAMGISGHLEKMECYTCHARWAPQCYGCHAQQNLGKKSRDWINTKSPEDPSKAGLRANRGDTAFSWEETRSYLRWESPILGINSEGRVSPFITGCQAIFTQIGPDGRAILHNKIFTTHDGFSGIAHAPIQPHTTSREARTCEDCHAHRKTLGLGQGIYDARANGLDIPFELERIVDEEGKQIQAVSHYGARPFNREEQDKIMRVNVCLSCHDAQKDFQVWKKVTDVTGFAKTNARHKEILKKIFEKGSKGRPF